MIYILHYKYKDNKKEETLVALHGIGGNAGCFLRQYKLFNKYFNVLFIDLPSHGKSKEEKLSKMKNISFKSISDEICEVLDSLNIKQAHFIGLSLGTMVIHDMILTHKEKIKSIIQMGSVMQYNFLYKTLLKIMLTMKNIFPYMTIYKLMVYGMMPSKEQKEARDLFIKSAQESLDKIEFIAWFNIIVNYTKTHNFEKIKNIKIPKLYIMGEKDFVFIKYVKSFVNKDNLSKLVSIKKAGHVCNIDNYKDVNDILETYFKKITIKAPLV